MTLTRRLHEKAHHRRTHLAGRRVQHSADDDGFPYSDWTAPCRTPVGREAILAAYGESFDLLLGRRTAVAPMISDRASGPGRRPVRGGPPQCGSKICRPTVRNVWNWPVRGPGPDLVEGVRRIKSLDGPDLILAGSSTLTSPLLEHGLADEVVRAVYPVLLGTGKRFFAEGTPPRSFELVSTKALPSAVFRS